MLKTFVLSKDVFNMSFGILPFTNSELQRDKQETCEDRENVQQRCPARTELGTLWLCDMCCNHSAARVLSKEVLKCLLHPHKVVTFKSVAHV